MDAAKVQARLPLPQLHAHQPFGTLETTPTSCSDDSGSGALMVASHWPSGDTSRAHVPNACGRGMLRRGVPVRLFHSTSIDSWPLSAVMMVVRVLLVARQVMALQWPCMRPRHT